MICSNTGFPGNALAQSAQPDLTKKIDWRRNQETRPSLRPEARFLQNALIGIGCNLPPGSGGKVDGVWGRGSVATFEDFLDKAGKKQEFSGRTTTVSEVNEWFGEFIASAGDSQGPVRTCRLVRKLTLAAQAPTGNEVGQNFRQVNAGNGGSGTLTYSISAGVLPTGTALDSRTGVVSGKLVRTGAFNYTIRVVDSAVKRQSKTATVTLSVTPPPQPLTVSAEPSPNLQVGEPYRQDNRGTGGRGALSFSHTAGDLPDGTTLDGSTGTVSGIPTKAGAFNYTVTLMDSSTPPQSRSVATSGRIAAPPPKLPPLTLTTAASEWTYRGHDYHQENRVSGASGSVRYSVQGSLPPGTTLDAATGIVSGLPNSAGSFTYTVMATDDAKRAVSKDVSVNISVARLDLNDISILFPAPQTQADLKHLISMKDLGVSGDLVWSQDAFDAFKKISLERGQVNDGGFAIDFNSPGADLTQLKDWYIAGIRIDPGAPGLSKPIQDVFGRSPQIRLVVQPVTLQGDNVIVHDTAGHLIFAGGMKAGDGPRGPGCLLPKIIPDDDAFRRVALKMVKLKAKLAAGTLNGAKAIKTQGTPLDVHPGFSDPASDAATKVAVRDALKNFLEETVSAEDLSAMAVMGIANGFEPWIFVAMKKLPVVGWQGVPSPALGRGSLAQIVAKFADSEFLKLSDGLKQRLKSPTAEKFLTEELAPALSSFKTLIALSAEPEAARLIDRRPGLGRLALSWLANPDKHSEVAATILAQALTDSSIKAKFSALDSDASLKGDLPAKLQRLMSDPEVRNFLVGNAGELLRRTDQRSGRKITDKVAALLSLTAEQKDLLEDLAIFLSEPKGIAFLKALLGAKLQFDQVLASDHAKDARELLLAVVSSALLEKSLSAPKPAASDASKAKPKSPQELLDSVVEILQPQFAQMLSFDGHPDGASIPAPLNNNAAEPKEAEGAPRMTCLFNGSPLDDSARRNGISTQEVFEALKNGTTPDESEILRVVNTIADPRKSHFFNTDCVSCHTEGRLATTHITRNPLKTRPEDFPFPKINEDRLPKSTWNVRNFGWFDTAFGGAREKRRAVATITRRTATETREVLHFINETILKADADSKTGAK